VPALTKYDVIEELGHGGMATVYRCHDKRLSRDVAVKVLHPHLRESSEIAHRFASEAKAVAKLRHPNIVEVFDISSEQEDEQYLVVEFVRGETLRKMIQRVGAVPPEIAAAIAFEVLGALVHAHASGVIHRDVKPENVLLEHRPPTAETPVPASGRPTPVESQSQSQSQSHRGERVFVKLTDFGIAKLLDAQGVTSTGQVLGSPAHMAPEQIEGGEVDGRADVFGLGVMLYECMVGHLPFEGNNPAQVLRRVLDGIYPSAEREKPIVGKPWSQILDRSLARKADARFPDAAAMRDAIAAELERVGVASPRAELEAWFDHPQGWSEHHQTRIIAKLCELGAGSRKRGDAVAAAADYNRALAYAPNDPQLLRIVASMHRAEARMRMVRRAAPLATATLALGLTAFFVTRALKPSSSDPKPSAEPIARSVPPSSAQRAIVADSVQAAVSSERPPAATETAKVPATALAPTAAPPKRERYITITSLKPPFGVWLSIDGASPIELAQGKVLTVDDKEHSLSFTCAKKEWCAANVRRMAGGSDDESFPVVMEILPARLVVEGEPGHFYAIEELPTFLLQTGGVANPIPMTSGERTLHVYDRTEPAKRSAVQLKAGDAATVSFRP
jgi:serine/threonine-protein kinase